MKHCKKHFWKYYRHGLRAVRKCKNCGERQVRSYHYPKLWESWAEVERPPLALGAQRRARVAA